MAYLGGRSESVGNCLARWRLAARRRSERWLAFVPTHCPLCRGTSAGGRLCTGCFADVTRSMRGATPRCPVCALALPNRATCPDCAPRVPAFGRIIAAFDYDLPGDVLIRHFKVERRFSHARMLAGLIADAAAAGVPVPGHTILVPVPASRASIIKRGFNPAAELARCLSWQLSLRCEPGLLLRVRDGRKQTSLNRAQRAQGTELLYRCTRRVDGAHIAVVDDVLTTGSTLHSIAAQFKLAGAESVVGMVVARTPYR